MITSELSMVGGSRKQARNLKVALHKTKEAEENKWTKLPEHAEW